MVAKAFATQASGGQGQQPNLADNELVIPAGYRAGVGIVSYAAHGYPGTGGYIQLGNNFIDCNAAAAGGAVHVNLNYEDQKVPLSIDTADTSYALNVEIVCELRQDAREAWQLATYAAIVTAYQTAKAAYDDQLAAARIRRGVEIGGRNPLLNRRIEREELKKGCLTLLTGSRFEDPDAIVANAAPYEGYPEIEQAQIRARAGRTQFLEQAFEWEQMTYLFYPYFWGRKANWLDIFPLEDVDAKFTDFLRAGAARVVLPVTPAYAEAVLEFLVSGQVPDGPALGIDGALFRSIAAEVRRQQGNVFVARAGTLTVQGGSRDVVGAGTDFGPDDVDRELRVGGAVHRITAVSSDTSIRIAPAHAGADLAGAPFEVGPKLVGQPWPVRVPTSLVYLRDDGAVP